MEECDRPDNEPDPPHQQNSQLPIADLLSGILLTSGNGRKDAHFITWFHGGLSILKKPDIFVIHEYVYEPANVISLVANAFLQTRIALFQIVDYIPDRRPFDANNFPVLG
jgi:hypothetical protein